MNKALMLSGLAEMKIGEAREVSSDGYKNKSIKHYALSNTINIDISEQVASILTDAGFEAILSENKRWWNIDTPINGRGYDDARVWLIDDDVYNLLQQSQITDQPTQFDRRQKNLYRMQEERERHIEELMNDGH